MKTFTLEFLGACIAFVGVAFLALFFGGFYGLFYVAADEPLVLAGLLFLAWAWVSFVLFCTLVGLLDKFFTLKDGAESKVELDLEDTGFHAGRAIRSFLHSIRLRRTGRDPRR